MRSLTPEKVMEERALISCLLKTIFCIPYSDWTNKDKDCIQGHLKEAVGIDPGGLSEESKTALQEIIAAMVAMDSGAGVHLDALVKKGVCRGPVEVTALIPTVSCGS